MWKPKVTAIQEAKDLSSLKMEELLSSLRVHEIELNEEEPAQKNKSIAFKATKFNSSKEYSTEEDFAEDNSDFNSNDSDKEIHVVSKKIQNMWRKKGRFQRHFEKRSYV